MKIHTLILLLFIPLLVWGQPPDSLWSRTYGSAGDDFCKGVFQSADSGYILIGNSNGSPWILKTDANGDSINSSSFGNPGENCNAVSQTTDSGFILCNVIFGEESPSIFWLRKTDAEGNLQESHELSAAGGVWYTAVKETRDGNYVLCGSTVYGTGLPNAVLTKTNANGDIDWSYNYGGDSTDYFSNVMQTSDGGFIATGYTNSEGAGRMDFWMVKTDSVGTFLWGHTYGTQGIERCWSSKPATHSGYILAGTLTNNLGDADFWVVWTDENGEELQRISFGGQESQSCLSVESVDDGGYVFSGTYTPDESGYSDIFIVRTDSLLNFRWSRRLYGNENNNLAQVKCVSDGFIVGGSEFNSETFNFDYWLLKLDADHVSSGLTPSGYVPNQLKLYQNYPNPFNPTTEIQFDLPQIRETSLKVFDITGRVAATLANEIMAAGSHKINFDGNNLPSGIYIYQLQAENYSESKKMILIK